MKATGITFIIIGIGSFILPLFDIQFILFTFLYLILGSELTTAIVFIVVGALLILIDGIDFSSDKNIDPKADKFDDSEIASVVKSTCPLCKHSTEDMYCEKLMLDFDELTQSFIEKCNKKYFEQNK